MVAVMVCASFATPSPGESAVSGPIRAVSWSNVPADCRMISSMIWVLRRTLPETAAKQSLRQPPGGSAILFCDLAEDLIDHPQDRCRTADGTPTRFSSPFLDQGVGVLKRRVDWFFSRFKAAGGRLDVLVLDFENGFPNWSCSAEHLRAIWGDPRNRQWMQQADIRDIDRVIHWRRGSAYLRWNAVMGEIMTGALNRGLFEPISRLYPEVKSSNYGSYIITQQNVVPGLNGHLQFSLTHCGTHNSPVFYGKIGALADKRLGGSEAYGRSPFAVLRWHLNTMRAVIRSSGDPIMPWVSNKKYAKSVFRDNAYYEELIYHLALSGADGFLYWNPRYPSKAHRNAVDPADEDDRILDFCLRTVTERVGDGPRRCITPGPIPWDSRVLATGLSIGNDKVLWRVTVPPAVEKIQVGSASQPIDLHGAVGIWHETFTEQIPVIRIVNQ